MGFINTPYNKVTHTRPVASAKAEMKRQRRRSFSKTMTAENVANILEGKYNIVETFNAIHGEEIERIVTDRFSQIAAKAISEGKEYSKARFQSQLKPVTKQVENMFRSFLDQEEMNGMAEGVPTKASTGVTKRGGGRRKIGARPSFVNSGIYKASFRCWADTK